LKSTFSAETSAGTREAMIVREKRIASPYAGIALIFHAVSANLW